MDITGYAQHLLSQGILTIPITLPDKRPAPDPRHTDGRRIEWGSMEFTQAMDAFGGGAKFDGLAIICGGKSSDIECIDFDLKEGYPDFFSTWKARLFSMWKWDHDLLQRLVYEETPHGRHIWYQAPGATEGNQKLVRMSIGTDAPQTLIETRGEGGYCIIAPTSGYVVRNGSLDTIPVLSVDQRDVLIAAARDIETEISIGIQDKTKSKHPATNGDLRPGDVFNRSPHAAETALNLLKAAGWVEVSRAGTKAYLRRPGKMQGVSATFGLLNGDGIPIFYPFTTSSVFQAEACYTPFGIRAVLEFGGDYRVAAQRVAQEANPVERTVKRREDTSRGRRNIFTLHALLEKKPPPNEYLIKHLAKPVGVSLFVGPPKSGKSYMALNWAFYLAVGGPAMGAMPSKKSRVLYLWLEGTEEELYFRMQKLTSHYSGRLNGEAYQLEFETEFPILDEHGLKELEERITDGGFNVVFIDTMQKIRPESRTGGTAYEKDKRFGDSLEAVAERTKTAIFAIHHTNRRTDWVTPFHAISGSEGLIAACNSGIMLFKNLTRDAIFQTTGEMPTGDSNCWLYASGRGIPDRWIPVVFSQDHQTWYHSQVVSPELAMREPTYEEAPF